MSDDNQAGIVVKGKRYVTLNEAMAILRVSRRTIYNWIALGKVKAARNPGGHHYIEYDSIEMTPTDPGSITPGY